VGEARYEAVGAGQYLCEKLGLMWSDETVGGGGGGGEGTKG